MVSSLSLHNLFSARMCLGYSSKLKSFQDPFSSRPCHGRHLPKTPKVHVHNLSRWCWKLAKQAKENARMGRFKREMEIKNLKLYMANQIIVDENEKLKRRAMVLLHENKILLSQLQKHSQAEGNSSTC